MFLPFIFHKMTPLIFVITDNYQTLAGVVNLQPSGA